MEVTVTLFGQGRGACETLLTCHSSELISLALNIQYISVIQSHLQPRSLVESRRHYFCGRGATWGRQWRQPQAPGAARRSKGPLCDSNATVSDAVNKTRQWGRGPTTDEAFPRKILPILLHMNTCIISLLPLTTEFTHFVVSLR